MKYQNSSMAMRINEKRSKKKSNAPRLIAKARHIRRMAKKNRNDAGMLVWLDNDYWWTV